MKSIKKKLYRIIFHVDTFWGKLFDIFLLVLILMSVILFILDSVPKIQTNYGIFFNYSEWIITILFTIEYFLRLIISPNPKKYVFSFWGIVDLLSILPTYIAIFFSGAHVLSVIRSLRLIRIFRVLNLSAFDRESKMLGSALKDSLRKIEIFLYTVLVLVIIIGTMMYFVEGPSNGFTSIPRSIYWAIVTMTTVGYGDITPQTSFGQFIASIIMITGYAIIAVPTGIVSAQMVKTGMHKTTKCKNCGKIISEEDKDVKYCKYCGKKINNL